MTVAQIAIAWVAAQGDDIVPLVGARRRDRLGEALGALEVRLDAADLAAIEAAVPKDAAAGDALRGRADGHARQRKGLKTGDCEAFRTPPACRRRGLYFCLTGRDVAEFGHYQGTAKTARLTPRSSHA